MQDTNYSCTSMYFNNPGAFSKQIGVLKVKFKVSTSPKLKWMQVPAEHHIQSDNHPQTPFHLPAVPDTARGSESFTDLGRRCPSPWSGTPCRRRATSAGQVRAAGEGCAGRRPPGGRRSARHGPTTLSSWAQWRRRACHSHLWIHGEAQGCITTGESINKTVGHAPLTEGGSKAKSLSTKTTFWRMPRWNASR